MADLLFSKWEGTGNDFILVDDRERSFPTDDLDHVRRLCDRHFGIGSDGLILVQSAESANYHMEFFNPDGSRSFCGNGSRCAFAFWSELNGSKTPARFTAIDGLHSAEWRNGLVAVSLGDVRHVPHEGAVDFVHNGSPHEIVRVNDPDAVDIMTEGAQRAHHPARGEGGTNVNFIRIANGRVHIRTFERGVEGETLSCGTGVVAAALSALSRREVEAPVQVIARGGTLSVEAGSIGGEGWGGIKLIGPVRHVFNGSWNPSSPGPR